MRIAFVGVPDLGIIGLNALIEKNKDIVVVVPPTPEHPSHSLMVNIAKQQGIPTVFFEKSAKEKKFIEDFRATKPDIAVVCSFNHKLPPELLEIPPLGFINCHPSLLPEYRGGSPYFHIIVNDERKSGVTFHYMDNDFDTGDIVLQQETIVFPDDTLGTLFHRSNHQAAEMLVDLIDRLEAGEELPRIPQPKEGNFKKAPTVSPENGKILIDWTKDAAYIEKFIRACNPYFGALCFFRGCLIKIWSAKYVDKAQNSKYPPGTIVKITKDEIAISTGKGLIFPTTLQIEYFMITDIKDFIRRTSPQVGEYMLHT